MRRQWRRREVLDGLLRDARPEPRDTFVRELAARAAAPPRRRWRRTVVALAVSWAVASTFGGLGYAGPVVETVKAPVKIVKRIATPTSKPARILAKSSSSGQYPAKVAICHRPPGNPQNAHTIRVSESAVAAHQRNHGDTRGSCPNGR